MLPRNLRRASRALLRNPLFTVVAVVTLALGIGASTAMFSVVYGVLLKPLPFPEADRLVGVWHTAPGINRGLLNQGPATYLTYRDENRTFEDIGLWDNGAVGVTGRGGPERLPVLYVTDGTLPLLRVQPHLGRRFTREDDSPIGPETVMLSYGYWERGFDRDPKVIGLQLLVNGTAHEIVGVLPRNFRFLDYNADLLLPLRLNRAEVFVGQFNYQGVARLKPGATIEQANADIARMLPLVMERFPLPPGFTLKMFEELRLTPKVRPLADDVIGDVGQVLWVLFGTVGIVLLIACANVANLFLIRAEGRQQELAVRSALGARPTGIAGALLAESLMLSMVGGLLGVMFAAASLRLLAALAPEGLPRVGEIGLDAVVLLFTLGLSVASGVVFGLLPLLRFSTPRVLAGLKDGGRSASEGRQRHRVRNTLVVGEIALALVLLVAAGLMIRTFQELRGVHPGFVRPEEVLTFRISVPEAVEADPVRAVQVHEEIARRLRALPGVTAVGMSSSITMDGLDSNDPVSVEDFPTPPGRMPPIRRFKWVSPTYFETMGNPVVAGRGITWNDTYGFTLVAVVTETFAREYWKQPADAIGKRIRVTPEQPWREIVGVVGDVRDDGPARPATAVVYWPMMVRNLWRTETFAARAQSYAVRSSRLHSPTFFAEVQQVVRGVNAQLPIATPRTLEEIRVASMAQTSFALVMLGIAAAVALALGVVGIYGVIAYMATQRTREIGIRMALGAQRENVSGLFLRHGLVLTGAGLLLGIGAAAALSRLMASLLFGVSAWDPATYVAVSVLLAAIALLASYLPARRAAGVSPIVALRAD
ncbi:MAG TPA: ABC transporter permease [Vicinamibacterales bacterium]|nr:ABC transporter permease [Vicinamibacterales bacterium]